MVISSSTPTASNTMNDPVAGADCAVVCSFGEGKVSTGEQRCEDAARRHGSRVQQALNAAAAPARSSNKRDLEALHSRKSEELTTLRAKAQRLSSSTGVQGARRGIQLERAAGVLEQQLRGRSVSPDVHEARGRSHTPVSSTSSSAFPGGSARTGPPWDRLLDKTRFDLLVPANKLNLDAQVRSSLVS